MSTLGGWQDEAGQTFVKKIALENQGQWQSITIEDFAKDAAHFGGPNDGTWSGGLRKVWIIGSKADLADPAKAKAALWLDEVMMEKKP